MKRLAKLLRQVLCFAHQWEADLQFVGPASVKAYRCAKCKARTAIYGP